MKENTFLNRIQSRLHRVYSNLVWKEYLLKLFPALFSALAVVLFTAIIESIFHFSVPVRTFIFFGTIIILAIALIVPLLIILSPRIFVARRTKDHTAAGIVGKVYPELKDDLLNALQLLEDKSGTYSSSLIEKAFERVYNISEGLNFKSVINFRQLRRNYFSILLFSALSTALLLMHPELNASIFRLVKYSQSFELPPEFSLSAVPGNISVFKGGDLDLQVIISGKRPETIRLMLKYNDEPGFRSNEVEVDTVAFLVFPERNIRRGFTYFFTAGNIETPIYNVKVIIPPYPENFIVKIVRPRYSQMEPSLQKNNGNISALTGSSVQIELIPSQPLDSANIIFLKAQPVEFTKTEKAMMGSFTINQSAEYHFRLVDTSGVQNVDPIQYSIKAISDANPEIQLISPESDVQLTTQFAVPLVLKISDDFGFSALNIKYRLAETTFGVTTEEFSTLAIPFNQTVKEDEIYYVWDVSEMYLAAGDVVKYYVEVADNDAVNGPKKAQTAIMALRVPSIDEVFNHADQTQTKSIDDLEEVLKEAQKLKEDFESISNELKKDSKEISFEEKEKIENAVENFEELRQKTEEIQKQLNEMKNNLQENNLLSKETMQKYMELQELMDEINSDELQKAFGKMQEMLEKLQRNQAQQNFENVKINEEAFQKSIERTLNLLKRSQVEQRVDELEKRTEKLMEDQQDISDQMNSASTEKQKDLAEKQKEISKDLEKLKKRMDELAEKMSELSDMPREEMSKMIEEFEKQQNQQISEQAQQQIQQNQKQEAMKSQQQLSQNMQKMQNMMSQMQQNMQQQNQMQVLMDLMKMLDNILSLSKDQEKLKSQTHRMSGLTKKLDENAEKQNELLRNTGKVIQEMTKLANKTFAITPEMGQALGQARSEMAKAISQMQNRNGAAANQSQKNAMSSLNKAAQLTQGMMSQMMNASGQGGGMMSLMQQLQQLSQQQMSLNQMTQMMQQGRLTQQQMAQLQRLAGEQAAIQKSLEQLNREASESGQSKKLAADLKKAVEEMKEVVENIRSNNVDDDVIQKQERILSRLLDAQRSINDRDFEKERESKTAKNFNLSSPPDEILSTDEGRDKLRDELLKAIREGFKKDYENLIRKYYEALQKRGPK